MSRFKGFTDKEVEEIKKQAISFWDASTRLMETSFFRDVNDYERVARCLPPQELADTYDANPDLSALSPPDIFINLKSLQANISDMVFGKKPYGQLSKFGQPNIRDEQVKKAESVLQAQNDVSNEEYNADRAIHQALYAGISCVFTRWTKKFATIPLRDDDGELATDPVTNDIIYQQIPVGEYAETIPIDIRRVRIDPSCDKITDRRIVGFESVAHLSELIALNRTGLSFYNFDETELSGSTFDHAKYYENVSAEHQQHDKGRDNEGFSDKLIWKREIRGLFRFEKAKKIIFRDLVVILGNQDQVLALKENDLPIPGWEMFDFPVVDAQHGKMFPMGVVEPAMDLWIQKFVLSNMSIDAAKSRTYGGLIGDKSALQEWDDFVPPIKDECALTCLSPSPSLQIGSLTPYSWPSFLLVSSLSLALVFLF